MLAPDQRAAQTLEDIFWKGGWLPARDRRLPEGDALDQARAAGYVLGPRSMDHDELVESIVALAAVTDVAEAAASFLASLSTRWLLLRPFLTATVVGRALPRHAFEPSGSRPAGTYDGGGVGMCAVCGEPSGAQQIDRNLLNFERLRWGGVRHLRLASVWFALDRFAVEGGARPTEDDRALAESVWGALRTGSPTATLTQSERALACLPSNKDERLVVLEQLSVAGVLVDPAHPGFLDRFVRAHDRALPHRRFLDRGYPGEWWHGAHGVQEPARQQLFGGPTSS